MSSSNQNDGKTGHWLLIDSTKPIKVSPAHLMAFIALNGFALTVGVSVASLATYFALISWNAPPQACADDSKSSAVCSAPETSAQEVVGALNAIDSNLTEINKQLGNQKTLSPYAPVGLPVSEEWGRNLVVDPKENPWINKLINALHDIGKRQSCVPDTGANPGDTGNNQPKGQTGNPAGTYNCENVTNAVTVNMEKPPWVDELLKSLNGVVLVDPDKNEWIKELVAALQQIQEKINNDTGIRDVVIDPQKNQALIDALQSIVVVPGCGDGKQSGATPSCQGTVVASNIDQRLRKRIRKKMDCNDGEELFLSKYIHFPIGKSSTEPAEKCKITEFMRNDGARATKWGVFGFASESGSNEMNQKLSRQRACAVKAFICKNDDPPLCQTDCKPYPKDGGGQAATGLQCFPAEGDEKTDPLICFLGEQHFINGVADSRSVVIAACKTKE